jgi:large subunit ribosomal protein L17
MRHKNAGRKFDRNTSARRAMFRNLAANLILHERIETTEAKAKELRRVIDRLITKAKRLGEGAYTPQDKLSEADKARRLHAQRLVGAYLPRFMTRTEPGGAGETRIDIVEKVFLVLAKRFATRPGGYTRTVKTSLRRGDNAPMVHIELLDGPNAAAEAATEG